MSFKRLRGTHDTWGEEALLFHKIESIAREVFSRFGFEELKTPILEEKELFTRALGTETDVVQKEMYEFIDRSKTAVAMRPEGTAGVVRAYIENNFDKTMGLAKFFYMGPMFRSERPQAGRLRQFHQIGVEQLGTDNALADAETIQALTVFLDEAGAGGYQVKLNNLGTFEERSGFKEKLKEYFTPQLKSLCEDCQNRLAKNPFRILDCKVETCRQIVRKAPSIREFLTPESLEHHTKVCKALDAAGIAYKEDPYMVRGLDYYTKTVFEISHSKLGAQDALAAGGRYDRLIESFGGTPAGAVGFAVGVERLAMCVDAGTMPALTQPGFFMVTLGEKAFEEGFRIVSDLRKNGVKALMDFSAKSMKSQMRAADKSKAGYAIILGDDEIVQKEFTLKNLSSGEQSKKPLGDIITICKSIGKGEWGC